MLGPLNVMENADRGDLGAFWEGQVIEGSFDSRTLANMDVALERVCEKTPRGEQHELRKRVANAILQCARSGKTSLGALTEAGERELARLPDKLAKSA